MGTTNEKQIGATVKDARDGWCNGCGRDMDLAKNPDYAAEAARRPRLHLAVKESVIRLCPDCAKTVREQLFDFSNRDEAETSGTMNLDIGDDLVITKTKSRTSGGGTWVCGMLNGHRFDALVFPEHADNAEWEIGDSRISKLFVQRLADKEIVYNWDRGLDVDASNETTQAIVDFLCAGLAEHTYGA